jgi:precorrin-6Y C5,15-methyltransferase (decarboxylating)
MADEPIAVVGVVGGECFGPAARDAIEHATVVVASTRHLASTSAACRAGAEHLPLTAALDAVFDAVAERRAQGARICVLASGDPGFFGIVRTLGARFGADALRVHPAPSSIALAFARLGVHWDDALVVSAHGRSRADAVAAARTGTTGKLALLCAPDNPPEALARALLADGQADRPAAVLSRLGERDEAQFTGVLTSVAEGAFDAMSVLVVDATTVAPDDRPTVVWGAPEHEYAHRDGMITKAEVRAVVLSKLRLPRLGVLWDVGAGSGSVGIECAQLSPGLRVVAIEHDAESAARIRDNARLHRVAIDVVEARAPEAFEPLPLPDRVFVGGGGIDVLDAAIAALRPGGIVVATYALVDRAVAAWQRLGNLCEVAISRGVATGEQGVRLTAQNPVFIAWGMPPSP